MSGFTFLAPTAVAITTVSPHVAIIAPSACLAILPVSKVIFFPSTSISCFVTLNIYFLKFNLLITFLYACTLFFFK